MTPTEGPELTDAILRHLQQRFPQQFELCFHAARAELLEQELNRMLQEQETPSE